jgi:hypothetical protein
VVGYSDRPGIAIHSNPLMIFGVLKFFRVHGTHAPL